MYGPSDREWIGFLVALLAVGTAMGLGLSYVARHLVVDVDVRWEAAP
jgi:hypothetical protein